VPGKVENFPNGSLLKFSSLPFGTVSIFDTLFFGESIYMLINPLMLPILYRRAQAAYCYAVRQGTSGMEFAEFGRQIGYQLLKRGALVGISYLLTPVNIVRYFEFPFVFENLPENLGKWILSQMVVMKILKVSRLENFLLCRALTQCSTF
jgi:hypothetical protein